MLYNTMYGYKIYYKTIIKGLNLIVHKIDSQYFIPTVYC